MPCFNETVLPTEEACKIRFELKDIDFKGVTVYSKEDLLSYYQELLEQGCNLQYGLSALLFSDP